MTAKPSATEDLICQAIRQRRLLTFGYNGQARVVAPYCYGLSTRDSEVLRAVQVGGASSSGGFPNYNPEDSAMTRIICRV